MKLIKIGCRQNITARKRGRFNYDLRFSGEPLEVMEDVAEDLLKNPLFYVVEDKKKKKKDKDVEVIE